MRKKEVFLWLLVLGIAGCVVATPVSAREVKTKEPAGRSGVSARKYAYSPAEIGDIRFFPVEGARWNGYEVTVADWNQLTDFLKMRYLRDAKTELEVRESSVILVNDMNRLLKAMDASIEEIRTDPKLGDMPVITFFRIMLVRNNAIKKAWTLVKLSRAKANP